MIKTRVAKRASIGANGLKSAGYTALLWLVFLYLLPLGIHSIERRFIVPPVSPPSLPVRIVVLCIF